MIKSYKYVLIIQIVLLFLFWFFGSSIHNDILDFNLRTLAMLLIGLSPTLLLLLSILLQKLLVAVINSDSLKSNNESETQEEKIWQTAFFTYFIFCGVSFLASLGLIFIKSEIEIISYGEIVKMIALFLISITISSFIISIFIRIKNTVWEVNTAVGILMIILSAIVFGFSLFVPSVNMFHFQSSDYDEVSIAIDSAYVVGNEIDSDYEVEASKNDYFSINELDYSDVETGGYFEKYYERGIDENSKSQELLKLFMSRNLDLRKGQNISELRSSITYGYYEVEFSEIQDIDTQMGRKPEVIRDAFESYKYLIYSFLSEKIYFESNLNLIVYALIQSHDDIYGKENPAETLQEINTIMISGYKNRLPYEYYDSLSPYFSDSVLELLKTSAKPYGTEAEYNWKLNAVWIYSFWSRRYKENNIDEVYKILKEIEAEYETM